MKPSGSGEPDYPTFFTGKWRNGRPALPHSIEAGEALFHGGRCALRLAPAATVDLGLSRAFGDRWTIFAAVENLFNERVETGRSADGLVNIAPSRFADGGVRLAW